MLEGRWWGLCLLKARTDERLTTRAGAYYVIIMEGQFEAHIECPRYNEWKSDSERIPMTFDLRVLDVISRYDLQSSQVDCREL